MSTYTWVDLGAFAVPFLASFHPSIRFAAHWRAILPALLGMGAVFVPWDAAFTRAGIWGFAPEHVLGAGIWGLPLEEWAFFVCIPYACLFSFHCARVLGMQDRAHLAWPRWTGGTLAVALVVVAALVPGRAYTCTAFLTCAAWLLFTGFVQRAPWLGRYLKVYAIMLLPFLVVNGILTGTGLDRPVVWYDNTENLGLRILTIPVEDVFYGMLMTGLVTSLYEALRALDQRHA